MIAPSDGQAYAQQLRSVYDAMELEVLSMIASRISKGLMTTPDDEHWLTAKLAEINKHQVTISEITKRVQRDGEKAFEDVAVQAYLSGMLSADSDLLGAGAELTKSRLDLKKIKEFKSSPATFGRIHSGAIAMLTASSMEGVKNAHLKMVRQTRDAYRDVITDVSKGVVTGVKTRQQIVQEALNKLADKGITKFKDSSGRNWDIGSYVEMATRTTTGQAVIQGHVNRMQDQGRDLVIVSDHPEESDLCRPHEGKVYSISGRDRKYKSLKWAINQGLFHPNCRHRVYAYIEGLTEQPKSTEDPKGAETRAKQRYIERQIRAWKKRQAVAITPQAKAKADKKVKEWQGTMRDFVAVHDRRRDYSREKISPIGGGYAPIGPKFSGKKSTVEITKDVDKKRVSEALKPLGGHAMGKALSDVKKSTKKAKEDVLDSAREVKKVDPVVVPKGIVESDVPKPPITKPLPPVPDPVIDPPSGRFGSGVEPYALPTPRTYRANVDEYAQIKMGYQPTSYSALREHDKRQQRFNEAYDSMFNDLHELVRFRSGKLVERLDRDFPEYARSKDRGSGGYLPNRLADQIAEDFTKIMNEDITPTIRVPENVLGLILESGRFKSQFETKTSKGALDTRLRRRIEDDLVGVPRKVKDQDRPIYGFADNLDGGSWSGSWYGGIKMRIKPEAYREKATVTYRDSLDYENIPFPIARADTDFFLASGLPINKVLDVIEAKKQGKDVRMEKIVGDSNYMEIQYHGGVTMGDVARIDIPRAVFDKEESIRKVALSVIESGLDIFITSSSGADGYKLQFANGKYFIGGSDPKEWEYEQ